MIKVFKYGLVSAMLGILIMLLVVFLTPLESFLEWKYDRSSHNASIRQKKDMQSILKALPMIPYHKLDTSYLTWTKSISSKYTSMLEGCQYRILKGGDFFKKIVGDFRINDFVCRDAYYRACLYNPEKEYYWLIDEKVLSALIDLQQSLNQKGFDPNAFSINSGHRHPRKNESVHAAKLSRHMKGQAVDLYIKDINRDGKYTDKDKQIVLDIAEKKVIGDKGWNWKVSKYKICSHRCSWQQSKMGLLLII